MVLPEKTPVASDIFTYCTREKIDTWHVVRNHNAKGIVDRVVCKACKSEHQYKVPKAWVTTTKSTAKSRAAAAAPKPMSLEVMNETWLKGLKKWGDKVVEKFDAKKSFNQGEVLNHDHFGKGVVQGRRENKVDVLFKEGIKILPSKQPESQE
jgi:hypothetical protein